MHFHQLEHIVVDADFLSMLNAFTLDLHRSLDTAEVTGIAVNDARALLDVDRVSLGIRAGRRCLLKAISGQDKVVVRSSSVKLLERIAAEVFVSAQPYRYDGSGGSEPSLPQASLLAEYVAEAQAQVILVLPLIVKPGALVDAERDLRRQRKTDRVVGCLVLEQFSANEPDPALEQRGHLVAAHVANALANVRRHNAIFMLPLLTAIGTLLRWFEGKRFWAAICILACAASFVVACFLVPWEYRASASGVLVPVVRKETYAPWDANVEKIFVREGQRVKPGDPLLQLSSDELRTGVVKARAEAREMRKLVESLSLQAEDARRLGDNTTAIQLQGQISSVEVQYQGALETLTILEERLESLLLKAGIEGIVATFDIEQLLADRPVKRGENLLQIASADGPWQLELAVPEHRCGHVVNAMEEVGELHVDFVLATGVENRHSGRLTHLGTRVDESEESGGAAVQAIVELDDLGQESLSDRRIGAEVHAKVRCGKRSLGYVLFGDVIEFLARRFWL